MKVSEVTAFYSEKTLIKGVKIQSCLTGFTASCFGQTRYFKHFADAKLWIQNVKRVKRVRK